MLPESSSKVITRRWAANVGRPPGYIDSYTEEPSGSFSKIPSSGVFLNASRLNHSCRPNSSPLWNSGIGGCPARHCPDVKAWDTYLETVATSSTKDQSIDQKLEFGF